MDLSAIQARWSKSDLEYVRLLATCLLAVVLAPLVIAHLLLHPFAAADHVVATHVA